MRPIAELLKRLQEESVPSKQRALLKSFLLLYPTALTDARKGRQYFGEGLDPTSACAVADTAIKLEAGVIKHAKLNSVLTVLRLYAKYEANNASEAVGG